jgi:hypothetical protein
LVAQLSCRVWYGCDYWRAGGIAAVAQARGGLKWADFYLLLLLWAGPAIALVLGFSHVAGRLDFLLQLCCHLFRAPFFLSFLCFLFVSSVSNLRVFFLILLS